MVKTLLLGFLAAIIGSVAFAQTAGPASSQLVLPKVAVGPTAMLGTTNPNGAWGQPGFTPTMVVEQNGSATSNPGSANSNFSLGVGLNLTAPSASSAAWQGINVEIGPAGGNASNYSGELIGVMGEFDHSGTGNVTFAAEGGDFESFNDSTGNVTGLLAGADVLCGNFGGGSVANCYGVRSLMVRGGTGPITTAYNFYAAPVWEAGGSDAITKLVGFYSDNYTDGTNNYAFFSHESAASNHFAFFSDTTAQSQLGGPLQAQLFAGTNAITSITAGAAAQIGTGGTAVCAASHICDSFSGEVTVTTGTGTLAAGTLLTVNFADTRTNIPNCVVNFYNTTAGSAANNSVVRTEAVASLAIAGTSALTASTVFTADYVCGGK